MTNNKKQEAIQHIENSMQEKGLCELYLIDSLCLREPFRGNPYPIDEICFNAEGEACACCHWDQRRDGHYLKYFTEEEVLLIEQVYNKSLEQLKKYRVQIVSFIDVNATDEINARRTASDILSLAGRLKREHLVFNLGDEVLER